MAVLDAKTIAGIAVNAGFTGADLTTAVAVALAESGGNTNAHNTNAATGDNSYGLWQINMLGSMGPARRRQFDISKNDDLFQPNTNAGAAYKLYKARGNSFQDWSVYKSGSYKSKLSAAAKGVADNGGASVVTGTAGGKKPDVQIGPLGVDLPDLPQFPDIGGAITQAVNSLGANLFKIGMSTAGILVAAILLILGVVILLRQPIATGAKAVVGVAGPGKVANVAGKVGKVAKAV